MWILLAFVPSGLILSTTTFLTTDIVAMPLLWVAPLGLYLLSFTFAFAERRGAAALIVRAAPFLMLPLVALAVQPVAGRPLMTALAALALLFVVSVALHARLYDARPSPRHLTGFYLAMALGGALGGAFAALVAPLAFDWSYEHPLLLLAAAALVPLWPAPGAAGRAVAVAGPALIALIVAAALARIGPFGAAQGMGLAALLIGVVAIGCAGRRGAFVAAILGILLVSGGADALSLSRQPGARMRSYFGIYTVRDRAGVRVLAHGTTAHGLQRLAGAERLRPTSYYGAGSGIGRALTALPGIAGPGARVGVVGLGAGTLACYARPGQHWRFFEIDPLMVKVARTRFSFLSGCAPGPGPGAEIVIGDARLSLARVPPASFDLLALDAFSSDAVPMHLLTGEAFALYRRVLAPDGLLLVHITNRHLRLEPVIAQAAMAGGWSARLFDNRVRPGTPAARLENSSIWVALSPDPAVIDAAAPRSPGGWRALRPMPGFAGWSDDYGSILPLIRTGQRR
ncbi:spermidine synthase [Sphingomonas changnyeongensis]|uniref:spermidine synthase n=1 Tax=Sphingomonas changnyeongensis TaxID=2698679 RepID=UPI001E5CD7AB|nr:fused MFS/spermidine synthase [Sphingomonas changnyeongensis]